MGGLALILWIFLITLSGLFMVFVEVDEKSPFYKIKTFAMSEEAKMQVVGHQIDEFLQTRNDSKFISLMLASCGGLGNMFYRFLSIYGIGRTLNRIPFIDSKLKCFRHTMPEFEYALPNFYRAVKFMRPSGRRIANFGSNCCKLDNVTKLERFSQSQYLFIKGDLLQAFGYFNQYKEEIRNDFSSHKMCVHTRLGDFKQHFLLESTYNFTNPALEFTARYLKAKISLILLGLDDDFIKQIQIPQDLFAKQYAPKPLNRTADLYFGSRYCDSLLITASGSTFALASGCRI
ncbi:putative glycosyltransferase C06E1.7 [Aphelenchoides bicaudatus]|nr:putative glycosyltransferase C06E1.7 [Aphelenchoides bicaudatus]